MKKIFDYQVVKLILIILASFLIWMIFDCYFKKINSRSFKDNKIVEQSKYIGQKIRVAPFLKLAKLSYTEWNYKYYQIIAKKPEEDLLSKDKSFLELNEMVDYKVFEVRNKIASFPLGGYHDTLICLLKSDTLPSVIIAVDCHVLNIIDEIYEIYIGIKNEIKKKGYAYLAINNINNNISNFVYKVNKFKVYKILNIDEYFYIITSYTNSSYPVEAESLMINNLPILIKEGDEISEETLSHLYVNYRDPNFHNVARLKINKIQDLIDENILPNTIKQWIDLNYKNSRVNRWVLKTYAGIFIKQLLISEDLDEIDSSERLSFVQEVSKCLSVYYDTPQESYSNYKLLEEKILEDESLRNIYKLKVKKASELNNSRYKYYPEGCSQFSPPQKLDL